MWVDAWVHPPTACKRGSNQHLLAETRSARKGFMRASANSVFHSVAADQTRPHAREAGTPSANPEPAIPRPAGKISSRSSAMDNRPHAFPAKTPARIFPKVENSRTHQ